MKKSLGAKTIIYPTPVLVVGTYDADDRPNAATVAWGGICCSNPPCVAISLRKVTYTHGNIVRQGCFTVNIPAKKQARQVDYFGIVSGEKTDKFAETGLTAVRSSLVHAPYIQEFPFALECKLIQQIEIGSHTQFVGEILDIKADEEVLDGKGKLDIERVKPFFYAPENNAYYDIGSFIGNGFSIGQDVKKRP